MSRVIVVESPPVQIASTVGAILSALAQNNSDDYRSTCKALTTSLIQLSDQLHKLKLRESYGHGQQGDPDEIRGLQQLLLKTRISASITYAVVDNLVYDPPDTCCSCCTGEPDILQLDLNKQLIETRRLVDAMATYVQGFSSVQEKDGRFEVQEASVSGVSSLTLTTPERLDSKIRGGKTVEIPLWQEVAGSRRQVYVVRTWINNPNAWIAAKRLVASLDIPGKTQLVIQLPENRDRSRYPRERTAFLTSNGILYAELKSVLPENPRGNCFGCLLEGAGTLLLRDHTERRSNGQNRTTVYVPQNYSVELRAATTTFELGLDGGGLGQFRLRGRKEEYKTYYECFVEATGEVLAIYLHRRRQHFGVVRFIGPGNHPELRDLIMGAMVAMGLDSQL